MARVLLTTVSLLCDAGGQATAERPLEAYK